MLLFQPLQRQSDALLAHKDLARKFPPIDLPPKILEINLHDLDIFLLDMSHFLLNCVIVYSYLSFPARARNFLQSRREHKAYKSMTRYPAHGKADDMAHPDQRDRTSFEESPLCQGSEAFCEIDLQSRISSVLNV